MRTRILVRHARKCSALAAVRSGEWDTPWGYFEPERTYYGDAIGRRLKSFAGRHRWIVARCNSYDCDALLAVNETDIFTEAKS